MAFDDLLPASFRGVGFLVNSDETSAGKRLATHEYVNSNLRFNEELGVIPPKYTMTGWVTSLTARAALERALKAPGLGVLQHPVYGEQRVTSLPYTVRWSQGEVGVYIFSLSFDVSEERASAQETPPTAQNVASAAGAARTDASVTTETRNSPPSDVPGGGSAGASSSVGLPQSADEIESATAQMEIVLESIAAGVRLARNVTQTGVAEFTSTINRLLRGVSTIVRSAEGIKEALEEAYLALNNAVETPSDLYASYLSLTDLSFTSTFPSTVSRQRKAIFGFVLSEHTRLTALGGLAAAMADTVYETQEQVLSDLTLWQSLFEGMVRRPDDSLQDLVASYLKPNAVSVVREASTQRAFQDLSSVFSKAMVGKQQNAWRVSTRSVSRGSLYLLTHQFYGGLDNLELMRGLNPDGLDGEVNIGEQ